jgi:hypothetical protein
MIPVACCLALASAAAAEPAKERWRLASVPLDMPEDGGLDDQALEGLYQGDYGTDMPHDFGGSLGGKIKDSVLTESPFWHIDTTLKDDRRLQLWFSSAEDGRKIFGVRLSVPWSESGAATRAGSSPSWKTPTESPISSSSRPRERPRSASRSSSTRPCRRSARTPFARGSPPQAP